MGFRDDLSSYMNSADLIITQAGHSTAMEIMMIGKPALIIPIKGQIEQENNAAFQGEITLIFGTGIEYERFKNCG